ncbi:uncharacterized protein [Typha angustifolia]|uniref:uncharacterized protein isoform X1 n=1 Tax=Typha angustifolia TaxID=59011 RepID=UPI003C2C4F43
MDAGSVTASTVSAMNLENGVHEQSPSSGVETIIAPHEVEAINSSDAREETISHVESRRPRAPKESQTNHSKPIKGQAKCRTISSGGENPSKPKTCIATSVKKNYNGSQIEKGSSVSNGSLTSASRPKQPLARVTNLDPDNARRTSDGMDAVGDVSPTSSTSPLESQLAGKDGDGASATDTSFPQDSKEEGKNLKPIKQHASIKVEEDPHCTSFSKPQKLGTIPSYGFTFKCDERAEKRKEFYSKLEEKIHAKELEKSTLQAKTKESQEAELKLLRKKLAFKATPMPSFYQEPSPPKVELKKIPPTRAKSPKLGRQKSSSSTDVEGTNNHTHRPARLSLDEKVPQNGLKKDSIVHSKKHQRNSLPKLPSEKTDPVDTADSTPPGEQVEDNKLSMDSVQEPMHYEAGNDEPEVEEENLMDQGPANQVA